MRKWSAILTILILAALLVPAVLAQDPTQDVVGNDPVGQPAPAVEPSAVAPYPEDVLYDNGPLITHPGACAGMDASRLQTGLGMNTLGFGHQFINGYRMADEFEIADPGGWNIDQITFFAYQTNAPTDPSPIIGLYFQIWDGSPDDPGSSVVFGDLVTNRLASTAFSGIQRDSETIPCANNRYIFANVGTVGFTLGPGTYWLEWMTDGNLSSGPWAPPITVIGETTTGNALQYTTAWGPALDSGSGTQQGMPFIVEGTIVGGVPNDECSNAKVITTTPYNDIMDTTEATTAPDDPETTCGSGANPQQSNSVWYSFTAPEDGFVYVETCGSGYDTVLAMFEGPCGEPWTEIACNDDSCGLQSELVDIPVVGGETYLIEVTDYGSPGGGQLDFYFDFTPSMQEPMFAKVKLVGKMQGGTYVVGAVVRVVTEPGSPVEQAGVSVFLKKPNGNTRTQTRYTNQYGRVLFPMASPEGGYWLACIEDVQHESYVWDDSGPKCDFLEFPAP